ncbi:MAG: PspC domain-containing protein [Flavobacteriales bacterium]
MNKTVTVNISGFVFYIEENAYAVLATYLSRIKAIFQSDEGGDEILNDVEARIAELFHEKLADKKEVVTIKDVEQVIQVMGKPEDYTDDTSFENANHSSGAGASSNHYTNEKRKIYRDSDDKVLGGVCSGFGHYFDIDPIILRIAVVLLVVFGGFGLPLYIILWIVIPKAETTSEKLRMHGEKINVESIK